MKTAILLLMTALLPAAGLRAGAQPPDQARGEIEQAVLARYDRMLQAAAALNLDEVFRFVAPNDRGSLILNGRLFLTRAEARQIAEINFRGIRAVKYDVHDRFVTVLSPTSALLITTGVSHAELTDGRQVDRPFVHSVVWVQQDGEWRVMHSDQTTLPPT